MSPAPGLLAAGADLTVTRLISAYRNGIFPWFSTGQPILWWSPNPRMILKTSNFKLHRSLRKTLKCFIASAQCEIRFNSAFERVIRTCATQERAGQTGTWIVPDMVDAYLALHRAGFAHSIETWVNDRMVGGLYVVAIGKSVFGESMFCDVDDASKIALSALVAFCRKNLINSIDCQQNTAHLASLGAYEIPRDAFIRDVAATSELASPDWQFVRTDWASIFQTSDNLHGKTQ